MILSNNECLSWRAPFLSNMSIKNIYLLSYNFISLLLWLILMARILTTLPFEPFSSLYDKLLSPHLTSTQSLALLEIIHASLGIVRASPLTTAIQVSGKNLVVWRVMVPFPELMKGTDVGQWAFAGCLMAWSASEVLRYGYFMILLMRGDTWGWLKWLRYIFSFLHVWSNRECLSCEHNHEMMIESEIEWQVMLITVAGEDIVPS